MGTVGSTANFTINFDDLPAQPVLQAIGAIRAQDILDTCEHDFTQLKNWFGVGSIFGEDPDHPGNRVTVQVTTDNLAHSDAYKTDGTTRITIDRLASVTDPVVAAEGVRMLFVAEMAEVLMNYLRSQKGMNAWNPRDSEGEALSRVMGAVTHPRGYYEVPAVNAPFVTTWLDDPNREDAAHDWIGKTDTNDTTTMSFGQGILFLYYLADQRLYSWHSIISHGGPTLAATYQNLTGQSDGRQSFLDLLRPRFPVGQSSNLKTDNPFPLLDPPLRSVSLSFPAQKLVPPPVMQQSGVARVAPYFNCPPDDYMYWLLGRRMIRSCSATVQGFGEPQFRWRVNGQAVTGNRANLTQDLAVDVDDPSDPDHPKPSTYHELLIINTADATTYASMGSSMTLENYDYPGRIHVPVTVEVWEKSDPTSVTSAGGFTTIDSTLLYYEPRFYRDREACMKTVLRVVHDYVLELPWIDLVLTLPDPGPELRSGIQILKEVGAELRRLEHADPEVGGEIATLVASRLGLAPDVLKAVIRGSQVVEGSMPAIE